VFVLREENPGKGRQHKKADKERVKGETVSSVICTNKREEHPDDRERVDGKTAHWSLSVGWFKLKILIKRGYTMETPLNSDG
jgi:hypothetical protein